MLILTGIPLTGFVGRVGDLFSICDAALAGEFEYTVLEDGTAEITKYTGTDSHVAIPITVDSHIVVSINSYAFSENITLTSITIPASISTIDIDVFAWCYALQEIKVDEKNTNYSSDSFGVLFNKDKTVLIRYPIGNERTSYTVPDSVTTISSSAFAYSDKLTTVTLGNSVTNIEYSAFSFCDALTTFTISSNVTTIEDEAFACCRSLREFIVDPENPNYSSDDFGVLYNKDKTELIQYPVGNPRSSYTLSDRVTEISDFAFVYCYALTEIIVNPQNKNYSSDAFGVLFNKDKTELIQYPINNPRSFYSIPDTVVSIASAAFVFCNNLTSITIGKNVKYMDFVIIPLFGSIEEITVNEQNQYFSSDSYGVLYNKDKTELIQYPSANPRTSYIIPDSVTSIGNCAFMTSEFLTTISIGNNVTSIGRQAFQLCKALTSVSIGNGVANIDYYAFLGCNSLKEFIVSPRNQNYSSDNSGVLFNKYKTELIQYPSGNLRTSYTIPQTVTTIGICAFYSYTFDIDDSNDVYASIFGINFGYSYSSLTTLVIPDNVTAIGEAAFFYCNSLTTINYTGSAEQWNAIDIGAENEPLTNADISFNYTSTSLDEIQAEGFFQIYSTNATNSVPVGEQMTFWFREYYNGSFVNDLDSCVISFAPDGVYQVTNTFVQNLGENNDAYYGVTVQAETAGSTLMTISDPNTGIYISIVLTATDAINVWRFNTVPVDTRYEEDVNTNFYNYNRLCIANFDYELVNEQPSKGEEKYRATMDAYNANYHYGAAIAYDTNGEIYDYEIIKPHKPTSTSFVETVGDLIYGIGDLFHEKYYYTGWSISTYTWVDLSVPEDGYIVITNNAQNPVVFMANLIEISVESSFLLAKNIINLSTNTDTSEAVNKIIKEILNATADEGFGLLNGYIKNILKTPIKANQIDDLLNGFYAFFQELDIDILDILAETLKEDFLITLPENVLFSVLQPWGKLINSMFSFAEACNLVTVMDAFVDSYSAPEIYIYQPLNDDKAYVTNGVTVIPENGVEEGYVAHSFIVGEDDTIILNAQTALDAISKNRVVYDVTLYQGGTATQPDGKIKVMLPIPEGFNRDRLTVYWVKENGELQSMHCYLEGEYICFETDHLSYYAILELNADSPSDIEPATSETAPPVTEAPDTKPSMEPSTEPPVTEPSEPEYVLGDVNGDGRITSADARLALRAAVSLETLDAVKLLSADANSDGKVTSADARLILRVAIGLETLSNDED